jgi:hypothetical protein
MSPDMLAAFQAGFLIGFLLSALITWAVLREYIIRKKK